MTSRPTSLAVVVQALIVLAVSPRGMATSAEIADGVDVHAVEIRRLLGLLRAEGIVESRRGPRGGWAIARDPATISLGRLYRIMAGEPEVVSPMVLDDALARARAAYARELDGVVFTDLIQG